MCKKMSENNLFNLDGKAPEGTEFPKCNVPEEVHKGVVKDVVLLPAKDFKTGADCNKVVLNVDLEAGPVSKWMTPKVSKGSGTYSNSALYDVISKAGLLEDIAQYTDSMKTEEQLALYLNEKLSGKAVDVLTKTVKPKDETKETYSKIEKVIKFE